MKILMDKRSRISWKKSCWCNRCVAVGRSIYVNSMEKDGGTEMEVGKLRILGEMREDVE